MKIVFMGSPKFSASILQFLVNEEHIDVVAVYTMPDAIRGRGNKLLPTPVKNLAQTLGITVKTPINFKDEKDVDELKSFSPDFLCVAAYGVILPSSVLQIPKYECLNIHGSLLPRWRGAAPVERAILAGDKKTGVSIMRIDRDLDAGDYCIQETIDISDKYQNEIFEEMAIKGSAALIKSMEQIIDNKHTWIKQDQSLVTFADKLEKRELWINPDDDCATAFRKIRASSSTNPAKCNINGRNVTILKAREGSGLLTLDFTDGNIEVLELKPDGKNVMDAKSFILGAHNKENTVSWGSVVL